MKCPNCQVGNLLATDLEENLQSLRCDNCGGNWIKAFQYWQWLNAHGPNLPEKPDGLDVTFTESERARICPECGHILRSYAVGHHISFSLDRCSNCGGIWFDKGEWDTLKNHNLHDDVNLIFMTAWQTEVQKEETMRRMREIYVRRFGEKDFAELEKIRTWLDEHPNKGQLIAFLTDRNPFKP